MALGATIYQFEVRLSNVDRAVYETLSLKVARHPSESDEYLIARVLAYCLEHAEGIAFSKGGLSSPDEPPIAVRDLTGALLAWIDIGLPDAARLHKAAKAAPRVAVYTHRDPALLMRGLEGERVHRAEALEIYAFDRPQIAALARRLERRVQWDLSLSGGTLYASVGGETLEGEVRMIKGK
jgi:uncharacterized protein YaeQ